jgi:hypothetical protein
LLWVLLVFISITIACSRKDPKSQVVIEIPDGFSGNFVLEMGVQNTTTLRTETNAYVVTIPGAGKLQTSTLLDRPNVTFRNRGQGRVWGYSQRVFTTGDGIPNGGQIEFFVGTQKEFEAEQNRKNKSGGFFQLAPLPAEA